jgi:hypothetical protein
MTCTCCTWIQHHDPIYPEEGPLWTPNTVFPGKNRVALKFAEGFFLKNQSSERERTMEALRTGFTMSVEDCRQLAAGMVKCMNEGLQGLPVDLKMLPSFVVCMPNGSEQGTYYALDLVNSRGYHDAHMELCSHPLR